MTPQGSQKGSLHLSPSLRQPLLKDKSQAGDDKSVLAKATKTHPRGSEQVEDASVYFIGTATTIIEWDNFRILTDPNFLHAGDHVHLGPGVTAERKTNPALDLSELPALDAILLSHYHEDHFDRLVEDSLNRDFPIITTPHAKQCLTSKEDPFRKITDLDFFDHMILVQDPRDGGGNKAIKITAMPGEHVPPGVLKSVNDVLGAVPPTNGWMIELGTRQDDSIEAGYRIYISGDTLMVDELKAIPQWLEDRKVDLMLIHLGGTTIPGPSAPLIMVTMDAKQGVELVRMINPDITIPIHYDDYDVFLSSLDDFKKAIQEAGLQDRVVYLDRDEKYKFKVKGS